jgi:hypothetical protein
VKIINDFFRLRFEVTGFQPPLIQDDTLSGDMQKDDDMNHDGPSNNSADHDADRGQEKEEWG